MLGNLVDAIAAIVIVLIGVGGSILMVSPIVKPRLAKRASPAWRDQSPPNDRRFDQETKMDPGSVSAFNNLTDDITQLLMCLVVVLGPVWGLVQFLKYRAARRINPNDAAMLEQMVRISDRLDSRLAAVERILDTETPTWRNIGGSYERQAR